MRRARSSPATTRRISVSTARSTPIAAASTAASIASRGRATPISACRPASISRAASSTSRRRRRCSPPSCARRGTTAGRSRSAATPTPISRPSASSGSPARILEVLRDFRHPVTIVTKSALIQRDIDILAEMARDRLAVVTVSVTTLDRGLARRHGAARRDAASAGSKRIAALAEAGIPAGVLVGADDPGAQRRRDGGHPRARHERGARTRRLHAAAPALGAEGAVQGMARDARRRTRRRMCMSLVAQCHGGKIYDSAWWKRMTGGGPMPRCWRHALRPRLPPPRLRGRHTEPLDTDRFRPPPQQGDQLALF